MTTQHTTRLNNHNTLTTVIEQYDEGYSVLSFDEFSEDEGGIWIDIYTDTIEEAQEKAIKQHEKLIKEY